jgi:hypothetical protein
MKLSKISNLLKPLKKSRFENKRKMLTVANTRFCNMVSFINKFLFGKPKQVQNELISRIESIFYQLQKISENFGFFQKLTSFQRVIFPLTLKFTLELEWNILNAIVIIRNAIVVELDYIKENIRNQEAHHRNIHSYLSKSELH